MKWARLCAATSSLRAMIRLCSSSGTRLTSPHPQSWHIRPPLVRFVAAWPGYECAKSHGDWCVCTHGSVPVRPFGFQPFASRKVTLATIAPGATPAAQCSNDQKEVLNGLWKKTTEIRIDDRTGHTRRLRGAREPRCRRDLQGKMRKLPRPRRQWTDGSREIDE